MERRTAEFKITLSTLARAQVEKKFIERTIAKALDECRGLIRDAEGKAGCVVTALDEAGFVIVRKPDRPIDTATVLRAFSDVMSEGMSIDRDGVADPLPKVFPMDPRAAAVRDLVESKRLVARAEAVLGSEAVDELLSWLPDVAEPPAQVA